MIKNAQHKKAEHAHSGSWLMKTEKWLLRHQNGVLLSIVTLILVIGLVVANHPTLWLGEVPDVGNISIANEYPNDIFPNIDFSVYNNVLVAKNVVFEDIKEALKKVKSPLYSLPLRARYEDVFIADGMDGTTRMWVFKADAATETKNYYDLSLGKYEPIEKNVIEKIENTKMVIKLQNKWQFIALLRNIETGILEVEPTFIDMENIDTKFETDMVGIPTFLEQKEKQFLHVMLEMQKNASEYAIVTIEMKE